MVGGGAVITIAAIELECWTLAPDAIRAWAENAAPGSELVYARGWLPARSAAAEQARRLRAQGLVTFKQKPIRGESKAYIMERLRSLPTPVGRPRKAKAGRMDGDMARVMRILRQCVRNKEVCPTNRDLARRAGVVNASYQLQKLSDAKLIENRILDRKSGLRCVTILATQEKTALPSGWLA